MISQDETPRHDRLSEAAMALRDHFDDLPEPAGARARVLRSVAARRARRRTLGTVALSLGVLFLASAAWAQITHRVALGSAVRSTVEAVRTRLARRAPVEDAAAPQTRAATTTAATPSTEPVRPMAAAPSSMPAPGMVAADPAAHRERSLRRHPASIDQHQAPVPRPPAAEAATGGARAEGLDDIALFRAATEQHLTRHDYRAALVAWDRYLERSPAGRFSLEARYNRALCLAHLGRRDEARAALESFSRGEHGGYRQREARLVIDALDRRTAN